MCRLRDTCCNTVRFAAMLMVLMPLPAAVGSTTGFAEETKSTENGLQIAVEEVRLNTTTGLDALNGQLIIRVVVTNNSDAQIKLDQSQFSFTCADKADRCNAAVVNPLLPAPLQLAAGETKEGWMGMNITYRSMDEPRLNLVWENGDERLTIDLNQTLRVSSGFKTTLMGPNDCLAVIELQRTVDQPATWILAEEFKRLKALKIRNVVLDVKADSKQKAVQTSYVTRTALAAWLASVAEGQAPQRFAFMTQVKSPVQFPNFTVAGMGSRDATGIASSGSENIYQDDRDVAIASCLNDVYDRIPLAAALSDLDHPEPGIRRAAIEKNIDRLTNEELQAVIDSSKTQSTAHQRLIAENLYRVSAPNAVTALQQFVESGNAEVSQAALTSLVKSSSPKAAESLKKIWHAKDSGPAMKRDVVSAVLDVSDFRHCDLLSDYARDLILQSAVQPPDKIELADVPADSDVLQPRVFSELPSATYLEDEPPQRSLSSDASILKKVLAFLADHSEVDVLQTARSELLNISNITIQDVVADFILQASNDYDSAELAGKYIRQRLTPQNDASAAPSDELQTGQTSREPLDSKARLRKLTSSCINTIKRFPDSSYTEALLQLTQESGGSASLSRLAFPAIMRCATDEQLNKMINDFDSFDRYNRPQFLNQLGSINHPQWLSLTRTCLDGDETAWNMALTSLRDRGTPEAIMVIVDKLTELRQNAESAKSGELDPKLYRLADRLIMHLNTSIHPEARRAINLCDRSSIKQLVDLAYNSRRQAFGSDPHRNEVAEAYRFRRQKQYEEARLVYDKILQIDPFYAQAYVSRSSLYLREGKPELAMADLDEAVRLDPDDALTESMVALAKIRLGKTVEGIAQMEKIVADVPEMQTFVRRDSLYNLACVYGRATERETAVGKREQYRTRGMEVLKDCTFREVGFDDVEHIENDPDLNVFHDHPEWPALLKKIAENEEASAGN